MADERLKFEVYELSDWFAVPQRPQRPSAIVVTGSVSLPDRTPHLVGSHCVILDRDGFRRHGLIGGVELISSRVQGFGLLVELRDGADSRKELMLPAVIVVWRVVGEDNAT